MSKQKKSLNSRKKKHIDLEEEKEEEDIWMDDTISRSGRSMNSKESASDETPTSTQSLHDQQQQHDQQQIPILIPLLMEKVFSILYGTAKTSSKTLSSIITYWIRYYISTNTLFQTLPFKYRVQDWTRVGKAWYKTLSLWFMGPETTATSALLGKDTNPPLSHTFSPSQPTSWSSSSSFPSSQLIYNKKRELFLTDLQILFESFIDVGTSTNTRTLFMESSRFSFGLLQVLKSEEFHTLLSHVPILYTHIVDALASGQVKQIVSLVHQQLIPHFIGCVTDETFIHSLAEIIAYTLQALEMERFYNHYQQQQQQLFTHPLDTTTHHHAKVNRSISSNKNKIDKDFLFKKKKKKTHIKALIRHLTEPTSTGISSKRSPIVVNDDTVDHHHKKSISHSQQQERQNNKIVQQKAQRRHVRNQLIQETTTSRSPYPSLGLDQEGRGGTDYYDGEYNHHKMKDTKEINIHHENPIYRKQHPNKNSSMMSDDYLIKQQGNETLVADDHVSSLGGDISVSMTMLEPTHDWVHQLGLSKKNESLHPTVDHDAPEENLFSSTSNAVKNSIVLNNPIICIPNNIVTTPSNHVEEKESFLKYQDKENPLWNSFREPFHPKDHETLNLDQEHDNVEDDEDDLSDIESLNVNLECSKQQDYKHNSGNQSWKQRNIHENHKRIHVKPSSSVLPTFDQSLEQTQSYIKRERLDSLLKEKRTANVSSSHHSSLFSKPIRQKSKKSWYPKSAAAAGCGDECGQETLRNLFLRVADTNKSHPRIFRPSDSIDMSRQRLDIFQEKEKNTPSIVSVLWNALSNRQKMILYFLFANVAVFLVFSLISGIYAIYFLYYKIMKPSRTG